MGGMLSHPVTSKLLERRGNHLYRIGMTDMQGYRLNMEDAMTVLLGMGEGREDWGFFGVFDGHAGDKASAFLGAELHKHVCALADPFDAEQLRKCVCDFDALFCSDPARREDGSTCVFAIVRPINEEHTEFEIVVSNTGDSRVVLIRGESGECVPMTEDHKPETPAESQRIYAAGGSVSMNRTDGQLAMSRAIGDFHYKANAELTQQQQKVIPTPDITHQKLKLGDRILVMCDGIVEAMSNEAAAACVVSSMKEHNDPAQAVSELFTQSLDVGSKDNHSAIIVVLEDGRGYGPPKQFEAGVYHPYMQDKQFAEAYLADAARHGLEGEPLYKLARETEERLGPFEAPEPSAAPANAGRQYLRILQQIQQSYNLQAMQFGGEGANEDEDEDDVGGDVS